MFGEIDKIKAEVENYKKLIKDSKLKTKIDWEHFDYKRADEDIKYEMDFMRDIVDLSFVLAVKETENAFNSTEFLSMCDKEGIPYKYYVEDRFNTTFNGYLDKNIDKAKDFFENFKFYSRIMPNSQQTNKNTPAQSGKGHTKVVKYSKEIEVKNLRLYKNSPTGVKWLRASDHVRLGIGKLKAQLINASLKVKGYKTDFGSSMHDNNVYWDYNRSKPYKSQDKSFYVVYCGTPYKNKIKYHIHANKYNKVTGAVNDRIDTIKGMNIGYKINGGKTELTVDIQKAKEKQNYIDNKYELPTMPEVDNTQKQGRNK